MVTKKEFGPVDVDSERAEPLAPGEPVEAKAVTQMGATFAERAGKKAPTAKERENSTFGSRAKAVKSGDAEDKAVKSASGKS